MKLNLSLLSLSLILIGLIIFYTKQEVYTNPKIYPDLITPQEARYILNKSGFMASELVGSDLDTSVRKSETLWISKNDPGVIDIYKRLKNKFHFNIENAEDIQVVKYQPGGFYKPHHDACCEDNESCKDFIKRGGQRVLTILIYLNDDFEEGSTKFPTLNLDLKAPKYGGVVFYPLDSAKKCHPDALHGGNPVKSGTKYIANIWVHENKF